MTANDRKKEAARTEYRRLGKLVENVRDLEPAYDVALAALYAAKVKDRGRNFSALIDALEKQRAAIRTQLCEHKAAQQKLYKLVYE